MCLAVRKEVVDDHADDREEEHDQRPDDLIGDGPVGLEDFNYNVISTKLNLLKCMLEART